MSAGLNVKALRFTFAPLTQKVSSYLNLPAVNRQYIKEVEHDGHKCHKYVKENVKMAQNVHAVITYIIWQRGTLLDFLIEWLHIVLPNVSCPHFHFNKSCCSFVFIFRDTSFTRTRCWNTSTVRLLFSAALTWRERLRRQTSSRKSFGYLFWVVFIIDIVWLVVV